MDTHEKPRRTGFNLTGIPVMILAVFLVFILVSALLVRAEFCSYRFGDNPVWLFQPFFWLLAAIFIMFTLIALDYRLGCRLDQYPGSQAVRWILLLSAVLQVLFILLFPTLQFADQSSVNIIAHDMVKGNFTAFRKGGYLHQYPNNVGITLFLWLVYSLFPDTLLMPKLLNVIFSLMTTYLICKIYENSCPHRPKTGLLILAGFFPPMILLNNLVYNDTVSTACFTGAAYYAVLYAQSSKRKHLWMTGLLAFIGNFLRPVGMVILIAVTLYWIASKKGILRSFAFFAIILVLLKLPLFLFNSYLLRNDLIKEPLGKNSAPIHMWLHMGLNEKKMGYWDDSRSIDIYRWKSYRNKDLSKRIFSDMILKDLERRGLKGIGKTYLKKNIWLWTEGTYQAEYYGFGSWGYVYPTGAEAFMERNYFIRDTIRWILHVMNLLVLGLACFGLIRAISGRKGYPLVLPVIILLGFIGFYTLWEMKPRYIYPAYPYLLLLGWHGLDCLMTWSGMLRDRWRKKKTLF